MELPRGYLSYSAFDLWNKSKEQFRKRYYENEKPIETPETIFGKKMAKKFEEDESIVGSETKIEVELEGIKLLGYLDSFNEDTLSILEFKTGHKNKSGKSPWDIVKVQKHKQLDFYCVLVELKFGRYNPDVTLQWLETEFQTDQIEFDGHVLSAGSRRLELTGNIETFKRNIEQWEVDKMKQDIIRVANEINEDYKLWKTKNKN